MGHTVAVRGPGGVIVNRIMPVAGPEAYKTYGVGAPLTTHWRRATCAEADCDQYRYGWVTTVDMSTELGQRQYHYIKGDRERRPSVQRVGEYLFKFVYGPGFRCFKSDEHRVRTGQPPRFYVAEGDWRGNPRGIPVRVHTRPELWHEDFSEHQDRVATAIQRG